jgi:hypothetical protein
MARVKVSMVNLLKMKALPSSINIQQFLRALREEISLQNWFEVLQHVLNKTSWQGQLLNSDSDILLHMVVAMTTLEVETVIREKCDDNMHVNIVKLLCETLEDSSHSDMLKLGILSVMDHIVSTESVLIEHLIDSFCNWIYPAILKNIVMPDDRLNMKEPEMERRKACGNILVLMFHMEPAQCINTIVQHISKSIEQLSNNDSSDQVPTDVISNVTASITSLGYICAEEAFTINTPLRNIYKQMIALGSTSSSRRIVESVTFTLSDSMTVIMNDAQLSQYCKQIFELFMNAVVNHDNATRHCVMSDFVKVLTLVEYDDLQDEVKKLEKPLFECMLTLFEIEMKSQVNATMRVLFDLVTRMIEVFVTENPSDEQLNFIVKLFTSMSEGIQSNNFSLSTKAFPAEFLGSILDKFPKLLSDRDFSACIDRTIQFSYQLFEIRSKLKEKDEKVEISTELTALEDIENHAINDSLESAISLFDSIIQYDTEFANKQLLNTEEKTRAVNELMWKGITIGANLTQALSWRLVKTFFLSNRRDLLLSSDLKPFPSLLQQVSYLFEYSVPYFAVTREYVQWDSRIAILEVLVTAMTYYMNNGADDIAKTAAQTYLAGFLRSLFVSLMQVRMVEEESKRLEKPIMDTISLMYLLNPKDAPRHFMLFHAELFVCLDETMQTDAVIVAENQLFLKTMCHLLLSVKSLSQLECLTETVQDFIQLVEDSETVHDNSHEIFGPLVEKLKNRVQQMQYTVDRTAAGI